MKHSLVSIITPTFNRSDFLREAIQSVINQTYRPIEHIIIDDGSTENIEEVVKSFNPDPDFQLRYIRQDNSGVAAARNNGVRNAYGDFIYYLDSDDLVHKNGILNAINYLENNSGFDLVCGGWKQIKKTEACSDNGFCSPKYLQQEIDQDPLRAILLRGLFPIHAIVLKKHVAIEIGPFNSNLKAYEDWEYWVRVLQKFNIKFENFLIAFWRVHDQNRRTDTLELNKDIPENIINHYFNFEGVEKKYASIKSYCLLRIWMDLAHFYYSSGVPKEKNFAYENAVNLLAKITYQKDSHYFIYSRYINTPFEDLILLIFNIFPENERKKIRISKQKKMIKNNLKTRKYLAVINDFSILSMTYLFK